MLPGGDLPPLLICSHCKPIWAQYLAFFSPHPPYSPFRPLVPQWFPYGYLVSTPTYDFPHQLTRNRTYLQSRFTFTILPHFKALFGSLNGPFCPPAKPIRTPKFPIWPCSPNFMTCPANQPKNKSYLQIWFIFSVLSHCKPFWAQYFSFFSPLLPTEYPNGSHIAFCP